MKFKKLGLTALTGSALVLAACSSGSEDTIGQGQEITIAHEAGDSALAAVNVFEVVMDDLGFDVTLSMVDHPIMFQSVAEGESDAVLSAWLPDTHGAYYEEHQDNLVHAGTNLNETQNALAVPSYMDVTSIEDLTDEAGQTITGIEGGAGITAQTDEALEAYPNLEGWNHQTSSTGAMLVELQTAYENQEEIVFPGWTPHWMNEAFDLTYLEDPEGVYGGVGTIEKFTREGFADEHPIANSVIENFEWGLEDIQQVMLYISEGADADQAAEQWVEENPEMVEEWTAEAREMAESQESSEA